jgi:hypothetical protein
MVWLWPQRKNYWPIDLVNSLLEDRRFRTSISVDLKQNGDNHFAIFSHKNIVGATGGRGAHAI